MKSYDIQYPFKPIFCPNCRSVTQGSQQLQIRENENDMFCIRCLTSFEIPTIELIEKETQFYSEHLSEPWSEDVSVNEQIASAKDEMIRDLKSQLETANIENENLKMNLSRVTAAANSNTDNLYKLAKAVGLDGMTYTHVVSEVVSRLDRRSNALGKIGEALGFNDLKFEPDVVAIAAVNRLKQKSLTTEAVHDLVKCDHIRKQNEQLQTESAKLASEVITLRRENEKLEDRVKYMEMSRDQWMELSNRKESQIKNAIESLGLKPTS